jgi:hypothetical protein
MRIDNQFYNLGQLESNTKIGNVTLPDFNNFHFNTKTAPAMSDEKYKEAIIEQAKKDAANGIFQTESQEYKKLMKSYVSVVSPDKKAIITNGLKQLFGNNTSAEKSTSDLDLMDILFGKVVFTNEKQLKYAEFKDADGNIIATYSNGGWTTYPTDAEKARSAEFLQIYNDAWSACHNKANTVEMNIQETTVSFDKLA